MDLPVHKIIKKEIIDKESSSKTCRLCLLKISGNWHSIEGSVKHMLDLVVRLKLTISESPEICNNCLLMLTQSYTFKISCLDVEEKIKSVSKLTKTKLVDLRKVLKLKMPHMIENGEVLCRICLKSGKEKLYTKLGQYNDDPLKDVMDKCLPEVKTETITQDLCPPCLEKLEEYFHFLMQCLATEEKINYYCEIKNEYDKIDLYNVYILSVTMEDNGLVYMNGDGERPESPLSNVTVKYEQPEELLSDDSDEMAATKRPEIVTLQVTRDKNGDEIITDVHTEASTDDEPEHAPEICITPMSEVLNLRYSEDPSVDEANASVEMKQSAREPEMEEKDDSSEQDNSDLDPDYLSKRRKPNRCDICNFTCETKTGLKIHNTTVHLKNRNNPEKKKYKCKKAQCQFESMDRATLKTHLAEHDALLLLTCLVCGSTFNKKREFSQHMAIHKKVSSPRKRSPKIKEKAFGNSRQTFKMFKCQFCPYRTRTRYNLTRHTSIHNKTSELKTYKCENCSFETIQKENLFSHMQSHNSELMAKKCFLCSFQPTTEEALKIHVELVHKNKSSTCI